MGIEPKISFPLPNTKPGKGWTRKKKCIQWYGDMLVSLFALAWSLGGTKSIFYENLKP
jgi:hypothetical protein